MADTEKIISEIEWFMSTVPRNRQDELRKALAEALELLKGRRPEEAEWEGDPRNGYWPVCGACHGVIGTSDRFCRHCGTEVKWD